MPLRYTTMPTPMGTALIVGSVNGLVALRFIEEPADRRGGLDRQVDMVAKSHRDDVVHDAGAVSEVVTELGQYFAGERRTFDLALDLSARPPFTRAVLEAIREIPYGETAAYGEVAIMAGSPRAARAVGTACARTPISVVIPVHRVVMADGSVGEYGDNPEMKRDLLALESGVGAVRA